MFDRDIDRTQKLADAVAQAGVIVDDVSDGSVRPCRFRLRGFLLQGFLLHARPDSGSTCPI